MKKTCITLMFMLAFIMLCGCGVYIKSYSATILITSREGDEASMEFATFKGSKIA